ncbi:MAG TPA: hypothetical protein VII06_37430 [Chloroflexota bacterium]
MPLLAGALQLVSHVAAADQPSLAPTPRAISALLVREVGGYSPTPLVRSTPLPGPPPGPPETLSEARPGAANDAAAHPLATRAPARRADAAAAPGGRTATARPLRPLAAATLPPRPLAAATLSPQAPAAAASPARPSAMAEALASPVPTMTAAVLPPRRTATPVPPVVATPTAASGMPLATAAPPTLAPSPTSVPAPTAPAPAVARREEKSADGNTPPAAGSAAPAAAGYKLGDAVPITEVLKGFAFTAHWVSSPEGPYATDWYPRSTTERCANSYRMPLAMPVASKWRLASQPGPMGGALYSLVGDLDDGNEVGFTHVDRDVLTGRVAANTVVGFVGISGLEQFNAAGLNPSHAHTAWNDRLIPGWDGDRGNLPARDFFAHYGFQVELRDPALEASPQTYLARRSCGGMQ